MVLCEFDVEKDAIINPLDAMGMVDKISNMPTIAVTCFEGNAFERLVESLEVYKISNIENANGKRPVYKTNYKGRDIALYMSDMGAPGAGGDLEEIYAMGVEKVIVFGSCGVLEESIEDCSIIIPNAAVRDEGLSYHYAPPSEEISVNQKYIDEFTNLLDQFKYSYIIGKTWTTDAFYRETKTKMEKRKAQGCICVDMECSALAAVAQFRQKDIFHFFYSADSLDGQEWDKRSLSSDLRCTEKDGFALLALEFAVRI